MALNRDLNRCFMRFKDRAERITPTQIAETFVSVGPLMDVLDSENNQIMYGRRGTGKTHALRYFEAQKSRAGDVAIYIDCQNLGSNGSLYNDASLALPERGSRLLVDVCAAIHARLIEIFFDPETNWNLADAAPVLDSFVDRFTETRVVGSTESERSASTKANNSHTAELTSTLSSSAAPTAGAKIGSTTQSENSASERQKAIGQEETWINFGYFNRGMRQISRFIKERRIWILIDEWSTVPIDIQPILADLLRRALFTIPNVTVKIAAIEHRSVFKLDRERGSYIGMELGADITPAINLDDYLVFSNNHTRSRHFFENLIENHVRTIAAGIGVDLRETRRVISSAFTQDNVFTEFVKATEGVPRDAMHILALAAQHANEAPISMPILRDTALSFYQTDKYSTIQTNRENRLLLDWIRDTVIGGRKTRAFMLPVSTDDVIIDRLFDRRALHIFSRSMSAAHRPGERFIVYKLDYGCYVDLINTEKFPDDFLVHGTEDSEMMFNVPDDDGRSYRRAILDLDQFYTDNEVERQTSVAH